METIHSSYCSSLSDKKNRTGMVDGAAVDERHLGDNARQSVGFPAAASISAESLSGDCAGDALVILVDRNFPGFLEVLQRHGRLEA
jgi:hypothetical protein